MVLETGINPSVDSSNHLELEYYALSNVAAITTTVYVPSTVVPKPSIGGTFVLSPGLSYIRLSFDIPMSINSLVDYWELYVAASSDGEWSLLQTFDFESNLTNYLENQQHS